MIVSCRVGPNYQRPPMDVPTTYKSATTQNAQAAHLITQWWQLFADPDLTRLEEEAIRANPDLQAAMERVAQARAAARIVQSQFYPQITLDPAVSWGLAAGSSSNNNSGSRNGNNVVGATAVRVPFDLGYEIDIWGRVARSVEAANAATRASADDFAVVMQTLEADVAQNYMTLRSLERQDEILVRNVELYRRQLALTLQKRQAGIAGGLDVAQAQAQLDQTITQQLEIRRQRTDTEHALAILTGKAPAQFGISANGAQMEVPQIPVGLPADLLRHRPDVAEAEQNLVAANANVGVAIADFYPTVRLTGAAGFENVSIERAVDWQNVLLSFGPSVSVPIFEGGLLQAQLEQARARYRELVASYRSALLSALRDVEVSLNDVHSRSDALVAQERAVNSSREYLRLAQIEYQQGIISLLQLIDADRTLLTAELTQEQLRNDRLISTVLLIKALGGGWYPASPTSRPATTLPNPPATQVTLK
jgi:multidrug efflux system outer membrane protein